MTTFWIIFLKKVFEKHFDNKSVNLQYNMLVRWDKRLNNQASDVPSIIFFIICYRLGALKTIHFYHKKINWNNFWKGFCKKLWKKIILGTSDNWSMSPLSRRPSKPVYYIEDWRIFTVLVALPKQPINQLQSDYKINQEVVRAYCPILYTVVCTL